MILLIKFFSEIFLKFPLIFFILIISVFFQAFFNSVTIVAMTPLVDFLLENNFEETSFITKYFQHFFEFIGAGEKLQLIQIMIFVGTVFLITGIMGIITQYIIFVIKFRLHNYLLSNNLNYFLNTKQTFFNEMNTGKLMNTFQNEVGKVAHAFAGMTLMIASIIQAVVLLIVPLYLSTELTLYFLFFMMIVIVPASLIKKTTYRLGQQFTIVANNMVTYLHQTLSSSKLIQSFGLQNRTLFNFNKSIQKYAKANIRISLLNRAVNLIYVPLGTIAALITLYIGYEKDMNLSEMAMVFFAFSRLIPIFSSLMQERNILEGLIPAYEQITNLKEKAIDLQEKQGGVKFVNLKEEIKFSDVYFAYPERKITIENINATIKKGSITSFVGRSGGGKTTLIDLLLGLYSVDKGSIKIDNISLNKLDINSFRHNVGYVPQEAQLFNISIKENILWGNPNLDDNEILELCKLSNAEEFIALFPNKLNTVIGDRGVRLSGGQRQRISLARAIAKKPKILILDEATSNLDSNSEHLIQQSLKKLSKKMTIIIVAHRISTIKSSDCIYVLEKGKIVQEGSYDELILNKNGKFFELINKQII